MSADASNNLSGSQRRPPAIILGSRGSDLARAQTATVAEALEQAWPDLEIKTEVIKTRGDERSPEVPEPVDPKAGRKGLFTAEIERALVAGEIDVAVHSAKDLPSDSTPGLELSSVLLRAAVDDVFVQKAPGSLGSLRPGAIVATGSVRRQYQLRRKYPGIQIVELRGNVPTRLQKLATHAWDAIVLARAGLDRLGYDLSEGSFLFKGVFFRAEILPRDEFLPAGGQGAIALQVRSSDTRTKEIVARVNHRETFLCLWAEREFLRLLGGNCNSPVGVLATMEGEHMTLRAQIFEKVNEPPKTGQVCSSILRTPGGSEKINAAGLSACLYSGMYEQK